MESAIEIKDLSKIFPNKKKEIKALDNISFSVKNGEIFGLLGPNGAGKTTTIRLIGGILKPTKGSIFINGQDIKKVDPFFKKNLGFLTENHGNYERLTVLENLSFFGSFYNIDQNKVYEVLELIGLFKRKDMKVGKLSKGQKQRLAIARAILHDPEIIFFDEPTASLDPSSAYKIRKLMATFKERNKTIFLCSHNLDEVEKLCDRVAILDDGKIKRIGTPSELRKEFWDTQEIICTLRNHVSPQIDERLSQLSYVKQYRIEKNRIFIYTSDADETTPIILEELVKFNAKILEVKRTVHSLEDIYLKLLKED